MYKLEDNLTEFLQRINFILKNEDILTQCIKDMDGFTLFGEKFGPFEKEKRYKLPFYKAIPFIENKILSIAPNDRLSHSDVQRFSIEDRDNDMIIDRKDKFFLNKIKEFKKFLEKEVQDGTKAQEFLKNYNSYSSLLLERRLLKLLNLSRTELSFDEEDRLTTSEQFLYNQIYKLIKNWRNFFIG